jgi:putative hemolysin
MTVLNDPLPAALVQLFFIVLTALCTGAEAAVCCVNDYKMKSLAKEGNKRAKRVMRLTENEVKVISAVQTGIMAFTVSVGALGAFVYVPLLEKAIQSRFLSALIVALCEIIVIVVFGDMIPKKICTSKPDECAMKLSMLIMVMSSVLYPISFVLNALSKAVVVLSGNDPDGEVENVTEDEIRMMVDLGSEKGTIAPEEKELITNIFEFGDMAASSVMTHRKDVTVLMTDETTVEWEEKVRESGNSRFPVCGEDIDDIVGVVYARELYEFLYDKAENVEEIIHQAYIVPETIAIDVLFENMQKEKTHFAIVADEYGGFAGIVTMDDILSEIVGEIEDEEYDEEEDEDEEDIVKISDSEWEMDGLTPLDEVSEAVGISLPEDEFDTLSGLILDCIDYVPDDGATIDVETNGLKIKATEIKDRRVVRAIVKKL